MGSVDGYKKNDWTSQSTSSDNQYYTYNYKFRDLSNQTHIWKWSSPKKECDQLIKRFGVPSSIYEPYLATPEVISKRNKQLKDGYFRVINNVVSPDYPALVEVCRPLVTGIVDLVKQTVINEDLSARGRDELIMSFIQDIPYGIPPNNYGGKSISGMFPPPLSLNKKWGDCDTKAGLFASIYLSMPNTSMVLLESPGHISVGLEGIPGPYDNAVNFEGKNYIFCEPVGPGKIPLGHARSPYVQINMVYPIEVGGTILKPNIPIISESISIGNTIIFSANEGNSSIIDRLNFWYNHSGENQSYYELTSPPKKDGTIKYSSERNIIFLMINEPGYYHYGSYDVNKKTKIDLDFSKGKCIYIKTKPNNLVFLFQNNNGQYSGIQMQADNNGVIRAIMESGEYIASKSPILSGDGKKFNREMRKGINFIL